MSGRSIPAILRKGGDFQELGHHPLFDTYGGPWNCHGSVGVSVSLLMCYNELYTEAQGLVEVDLSAILDPFGTNQFMSCPQAMSFFQRLCPAPFPPVSILRLICNEGPHGSVSALRAEA